MDLSLQSIRVALILRWQANRNENVCNYCQVHNLLLLFSRRLNFAILKYANFEETVVLSLFYYGDHMTDFIIQLARIWTLLNSLPIHYFITQMT